MEPTMLSPRRIRMMPHGPLRNGPLRHGPLRRGLVVAAGWGLLCAVVAGCGSVVAPTGASTPGGVSSATGSASAGGAAAGASGDAAASASAPGPAGASGSSGPAGASASVAVGCASVNQATAVSATRLTRLEVPVDGVLMVTDRKPAQVQALFRDFCNAVTHPNPPSAVMRCPADFGTSYSGVFYDGNRVLARYTYDASGCRQVSVITGAMMQSTVLAGPAAFAAPHLVADFAAVLTGAKPSVIPTTSNMNRGGTA